MGRPLPASDPTQPKVISSLEIEYTMVVAELALTSGI